jgi:hypothetical protein
MDCVLSVVVAPSAHVFVAARWPIIGRCRRGLQIQSLLENGLDVFALWSAGDRDAQCAFTGSVQTLASIDICRANQSQARAICLRGISVSLQRQLDDARN